MKLKRLFTLILVVCALLCAFGAFFCVAGAQTKNEEHNKEATKSAFFAGTSKEKLEAKISDAIKEYLGNVEDDESLDINSISEISKIIANEIEDCGITLTDSIKNEINGLIQEVVILHKSDFDSLSEKIVNVFVKCDENLNLYNDLLALSSEFEGNAKEKFDDITLKISSVKAELTKLSEDKLDANDFDDYKEAVDEKLANEISDTKDEFNQKMTNEFTVFKKHYIEPLVNDVANFWKDYSSYKKKTSDGIAKLESYVNDHIDGYNSFKSGYESYCHNLEISLVNISEALNLLSSTDNSIISDINALSTSIDDILLNINDYKILMDNFRLTTENAIITLNLSLENAVKRIENNENRIGANQNQISDNKNQISANQSQISANQSQINANQNQISINQDMINANQEQISNTQNQLSKTQGDVEEIQTKVNNFETKIATNEGQIGNINNSLGGCKLYKGSDGHFYISDGTTSKKLDYVN